MPRIHASAILADVIDNKPIGNFIAKQLIGDAMCANGTAVNGNGTIAGIVYARRPGPAFIGAALVNLLPEAIP
jgi:hypothetical protein